MRRKRKEPKDVVFVGDALKRSITELPSAIREELGESGFWLGLAVFILVPTLYYCGTALTLQIIPMGLWKFIFQT